MICNLKRDTEDCSWNPRTWRPKTTKVSDADFRQVLWSCEGASEVAVPVRAGVHSLNDKCALLSFGPNLIDGKGRKGLVLDDKLEMQCALFVLLPDWPTRFLPSVQMCLGLTLIVSGGKCSDGTCPGNLERFGSVQAHKRASRNAY